MGREVIFTVDFAGRKKDEKVMCDSAHANTLVRHDKVAKYADKEHQARLEKAAKEEDARDKAAQEVIKNAKSKLIKEENKRLNDEAKAEKERQKATEALIEKHNKAKK